MFIYFHFFNCYLIKQNCSWVEIDLHYSFLVAQWGENAAVFPGRRSCDTIIIPLYLMAISIVQRTKLCCTSTVFLTYQGNIAELTLNCIQPINLCRQPMIDKKYYTSLLPLFYSNYKQEHVLVKMIWIKCPINYRINAM